jgi:crotonobetainyl-CoA:carnitine CoA-transferase CaiB-like acyl-CoA transferase
MADATATLASTSALLAAGGHFSPRRLGSESPLAVPSGVFTAADGEQVQIICVTERHWRALCDALDHSEWVEDPACLDSAARIANRQLVRDRIAAVIASGTASDWVERISRHGAICERVRDIEEAWADERLVARGLVGQGPDGPPWTARMPVVSLARTNVEPPVRLTPAPRLGADTEAVAEALPG